jgi:hypothetical protein
MLAARPNVARVTQTERRARAARNQLPDRQPFLSRIRRAGPRVKGVQPVVTWHRSAIAPSHTGGVARGVPA